MWSRRAKPSIARSSGVATIATEERGCTERRTLKGLGAKPEGTADEGIAALVEAETAVSCPRNTDPGADTNCSLRPRGAAKPEPALPRTEINAIEAFIDVQCRGKAPGAACQVEQARNTSVTLHPLNSVQRLKRADQGASPHTGYFACDVKEPA